MLAAAIATGVLAPGDGITFVLSDLASAERRCREGSQDWIFLCFAAAFLVKMPAFPFHGWMPDGYRAMPLPVLAVFSGVLSRSPPTASCASRCRCSPTRARGLPGAAMLLIALASILYGSAMAFTTTNTRLILGYSSIAQLGFIVLGIFALRAGGRAGRGLQAVNHGLVVAPAFFIVALLARARRGSEDLRDMGGLAFRAPVLAGAVPDRRAGQPGDARLVELRRRVPDPARRLQREDRHRDRRLHRRRAGQRLHAAPVHPRDAQPPGPAPALSREIRSRRARARAARARASSRSRCTRSSRWTARASVGDSEAIGSPASTPPVEAAADRPCRDASGRARRDRRTSTGRAVAAARAARRRDRRAAGRAAALARSCASALVPAARDRRARRAIGLSIWQWGERDDLISGALRLDALTLCSTFVFCVAGIAAVLLSWRARRAARGRARRVLRAAADLGGGMFVLVGAQNLGRRCSSASSCCRSRSTCCARPRCAARRRSSRG